MVAVRRQMVNLTSFNVDSQMSYTTEPEEIFFQIHEPCNYLAAICTYDDKLTS